MATLPLTQELIEKAQKTIAPYARKTPLLPFDYLNRETEKKILLKCENLQVTGSFKIRGAANCILENISQAKKAGVVAASAGNHAQGVAAVCSMLGIPSTIVMPTVTPAIKLQNTKRWGAETILMGSVYNESFDFAVKLSQEKGLLLVHPYRDMHIMAGQGTIGLELLADPAFEDCEAIVIPIGGGGLLTGIAKILRAKNKKIKIYGVTAESAPATYLSIQSGKIQVQTPHFTLAEGVSTKTTDETMLAHLKESLDDVFSISENSIAHAISLVAEHGKLLIEGSAAISIAAILDGLVKEKKVTALLSGGNIDLPALGHVLQHGLAHQGRLVRIVISIADRPGGLNKVTEILSQTGANIIQVFHQRATLHTKIGEADIEVDFESKGHEHTSEIINLLLNRGFKVTRVE